MSNNAAVHDVARTDRLQRAQDAMTERDGVVVNAGGWFVWFVALFFATLQFAGLCFLSVSKPIAFLLIVLHFCFIT